MSDLMVEADALIVAARKRLHRRGYDTLIGILRRWYVGELSRIAAESELIMHISRTDVKLARRFCAFLDHTDRLQAARACKHKTRY